MFHRFWILLGVLLILSGKLKAQGSLQGTYKVVSFEDDRGASFVLNDSNTWMNYFRYVLRPPETPITITDSLALRSEIRFLINQMAALKMIIVNDSQVLYPQNYDEGRKEMTYTVYLYKRESGSKFFDIIDINSSSGLTGLFEIKKDLLIQLGGTGEKLFWRKSTD